MVRFALERQVPERLISNLVSEFFRIIVMHLQSHNPQ
jgi:hypothetical protein